VRFGIAQLVSLNGINRDREVSDCRSVSLRGYLVLCSKGATFAVILSLLREGAKKPQPERGAVI
jgi:hypothetical protein